MLDNWEIDFIHCTLCNNDSLNSMMRRKKRKTDQSTIFHIEDGKFCMSYDSGSGSCFGDYPEPTFIIKDIDCMQLMKKLGIKDESNIRWALNGLPASDNDVIRLKNYCDENGIEYTYLLED